MPRRAIDWNPVVKLSYTGKSGRRFWQVTRLGAAIHNARNAWRRGAKHIEITDPAHPRRKYEWR